MLAERSTDLLGHCSASARWDSTDDSKSLSLVGHSMAAAERWVGLVVYQVNIHRVALEGVASVYLSLPICVVIK